MKLGITKRFDKDWNEVEYPDKPFVGGGIETTELVKYNNAKEYSVLVGLSEYVEKLSVQHYGSGIDAWKRLWRETYSHKQLITQPPQLSDFIPAVKEDGKWRILSNPVEYPLQIVDPDKVNQYQKALEAVKYLGWEVVNNDNLGIQLALTPSLLPVTLIFRPNGFVEFNPFHELIPTTESLITELGKHNQYLILKD